ncbi:hypothetical protein [Moheibacter stercoris]|uniref:Dolichyl-phosphate-mannose-protein mannosyltransferase n=1 Tax=Moheibacter stercoris TaxID=1628251 RepID=A0ABV2LSH4_9FLAO
MLLYNHRLLKGIYSILLALLFFLLVVSSLGFLFNIKLSEFHFPIAIILALVTTYFLYGKNDLKNYISSFLWASLILMISYFLSINYYDFSFDGMAYHQDAVVQLAEGWNPIKEKTDSQYAIWLNHYQKGIEIMQANFYLISNKLESVKTINFLLLISCLLVVFEAIKLTIKNTFSAFFLAILASFSLIVISQLFTNYNDGLYYLLYISLVASMILVYQHKTNFYWANLIMISILLCNIKFSTLPSFVVLVAVFLAFIIYKKNWTFIRPAVISLTIVFFAGIITTFNPLLTNINEGKHIFHPLMGTEKVDIISQVIPHYMSDQGKLERLKTAFFSEVTNIYMMNEDRIPVQKSKIPFTIQPGEIEFLHHYDLRLSGFGVFASGILLLSVLILIVYPLYMYIYKREVFQVNKEKLLVLYTIVFGIIITTFINPEFWWARYVPQLWLINIIALVMIWDSKQYFFRALKFFLLFSLFFNFYLGLTQTLKFEINSTKEINSLLKDWKTDGVKLKIDQQNFFHVYKRFEENNIPFELTKITEGHFIYLPNTFANVKIQEISNIASVDTLMLSDLGLSNDANFIDFLRKFDSETLLISAKDEASNGFNNEQKNKIYQEFKLNLPKLGYRNSYVSIISNNKVLLEEIDDQKQITFENHKVLNDLGITKMKSGGYRSGNVSSIRINGADLSLNKRGLNIVLIKDKTFYQVYLDSYNSDRMDSVVYKVNFKTH